MSAAKFNASTTAFLWALRCDFIEGGVRITPKGRRYLPAWAWRALNRWRCRWDPEHKAAVYALLKNVENGQLKVK